jgi:hypothetical protein
MTGCLVSNSQWVSALGDISRGSEPAFAMAQGKQLGPKLMRCRDRAALRAEGPNSVQSSVSFAGAGQ